MNRLWPKDLQRIETPQAVAEIVLRRCKSLLSMWPIHVNKTMLEQLALSAYLQGACDLYDALQRRK